jgi:hypothetical protein
MIYVKSILAGLLALIMIAVLAVVFAPLVMDVMKPAAGWNFVHLPLVPMAAGALAISAAVSWAVFRRIRKG